MYNKTKLKELFRINKVITILKFKSAVNLQRFLLEAQLRANSIAKSHSVALSRLRLQ